MGPFGKFIFIFFYYCCCYNKFRRSLKLGKASLPIFIYVLISPGLVLVMVKSRFLVLLNPGLISVLVLPQVESWFVWFSPVLVQDLTQLNPGLVQVYVQVLVPVESGFSSCLRHNTIRLFILKKQLPTADMSSVYFQFMDKHGLVCLSIIAYGHILKIQSQEETKAYPGLGGYTAGKRTTFTFKLHSTNQSLQDLN